MYEDELDEFGINVVKLECFLGFSPFTRKWTALISFISDDGWRDYFNNLTDEYNPEALWDYHYLYICGQYYEECPTCEDKPGCDSLVEAFKDVVDWDKRLETVLGWIEPVALRQRFEAILKREGGRDFFLYELGHIVHKPNREMPVSKMEYWKALDQAVREVI